MTQLETYTKRLIRLQSAGWKKVVPVQLPYELHLKSICLPGSTLEVGCGIGRNLAVLGDGAVGVDIDDESVRYVVERLRMRAFTPEDFFRGGFRRGAFDNLLFSHVLEHVAPDTLNTMVASYLPYVRSGGRIIVITPQERGYASDSTHVAFIDHAAVARLAQTLGLTVEQQYSFPLPRVFGRAFPYNEFISLLRLP